MTSREKIRFLFRTLAKNLIFRDYLITSFFIMSTQQQVPIDEQADTEEHIEVLLGSAPLSQDVKKGQASLDKQDNPRSLDCTETKETEFEPRLNVQKFP